MKHRLWNPRVGWVAWLAALAILIALGSEARAQTCFYYEDYKVAMPAGLAAGDQYGYSVAVNGDWLFAGAPTDDQIGTNAGAVYVFHKNGDAYDFHQKLVATGSVGEAHFGWSLAAEGEVLLIGAENDDEINQTNPNAWGAAYVFRLVRDEWVQEQKLFGFGIGNARQLGWAVALSGDIAVVGCRATTAGNVTGEGAAFVYRHDGASWVNEQRLTSDQPTANDRFGAALAFGGNNLFVGSQDDNSVATDAGAVFVFIHDGNSWVLQQELHAFDGTATDRFGWSVAANGAIAVIGAPFDDPAGADSGSAYLFHFDGQSWQVGQKLTLASPAADDRFGTAVSVLDDRVIVGVPNREVIETNNLGNPVTRTDAGIASIFRDVNGQWAEQRQLKLYLPVNPLDYPIYPCWANGPPPSGWPPSISRAKLAATIASSSDGLFFSSAFARPQCWEYTGVDTVGSVCIFRIDEAPFIDCNFDAGPDICDFTGDANGNYAPDECDLTSGESQDCNSNKLPDECDAGFLYSLSDDFASANWYHGLLPEFIWLNQFRIRPGGQVITHIGIETTVRMPFGAPVTALLYTDPNNDGNPVDAVLIAQAETTAVGYDYTNPFIDPPRMVYVRIPPTYVGAPGSFFFAGAVVRPPITPTGPVWAVPAADTGTHVLRRSWSANAGVGQADIENLANNEYPVTNWTQGPWSIRAVASDCNLNGVWDECDIGSGFSLDINGNGIPDECDVPDCLFSDISPRGGDGQVGVPDLLHVINHWGVCNPCFAICEGDIDDDCAVGVPDLLTVINGWGPCP